MENHEMDKSSNLNTEVGYRRGFMGVFALCKYFFDLIYLK